MRNNVAFDESFWTKIEPLLPDDSSVKKAVLEDFMWFMGRSKKYKSNQEKVEDYIRHLQLKANPVFDVRPEESRAFKCIDVEAIREKLM